MADLSPCPPEQELQQLLLGRLSDSQAERLERHLLECSCCVAVMRNLKDEGRLLASLRDRGASTMIPQDEAVEKLTQLVAARTVAVACRAEEQTMPPREAAVQATEYEATSGLAPPQRPDEIGRLGSYRILSVLGAGGMGVVYLAEDVQLQRQVAVKVLKGALAASAVNRERFLREARAAAGISHDHIITVHHVGEENGVPFLVMPLLQGESLQTRLSRPEPVPLAEVLRIGRETAEGLAAAHEHGLIHRDVKPDNVWLERYPLTPQPPLPQRGEGEPDKQPLPPLPRVGEGGRGGEGFRVKILDFGLAQVEKIEHRLTQKGVILGTPSFMAPEQARGGTVDARCDLYSLGVVLYYLCTGRLPFPQNELIALLAAVALDPPPPVQEINPDIPPALADLIMQLLAKQPEERPAPARLVAEALRAIEQLPEGLLPAPAPRRRRKRRWPLGLAALVLLGLLGLGGWYFGPTVYRLATNAKEDGQETAKGPGDGGGKPPPAVAVGHVRTFEEHGNVVSGVAFDGGGRLAVSGDWDGKVLLWEVATGKRVAAFQGGDKTVRCVAITPDGKRIAAGGGDFSVRLWDPNTDKPQPPQQHDDHKDLVTGVAFAQEGRVLISASQDGTVRGWSTARRGKVAFVLPTDPADGMGKLSCLAVSPDGRWLLCGGQGKLVHLWDLEKQEHVGSFKGHSYAVLGVAFSGNGQVAASGSADATVRVWKVPEGEMLHLLTLPSSVHGVALTRDGKRVLAGCGDGTVRLWDVAGERELQVFKGHKGRVWSVALSADGRLALSGGDDHTVRLWGLPAAE
jgi:serine/threonine protein kinase